MLAAEALIEAGERGPEKEMAAPKSPRGEVKGTLALSEPDSGADPGYVQMAARAEDGGYALDGTKAFVPDAHVADLLVVAARTSPGDEPDRGLTLFLVEGRGRGGWPSSRCRPWTARASCARSSSRT